MDNDLDTICDHPAYETGFINFDKEGSGSPLYYELSDYMIKKRGFKTIGNYNWIYEDTHYYQITDEMVNKIIIQLTQRKAKPAWLSNYYKVVRSEAQIKREEFERPDALLNVSNGVINVKTKFLYPHNDAYNFKNVIPIKYDVDAKCPNFMTFLEFVFQGDQELINATSEIFGYCLLGGDPFLHKSFVLLGDGRNGKSTWLHVLRKLVGDSNCSSVSMGLLNKPFSAVRLDGKLANITGELPTSKLDSEVFKTAVGGEYITAAHKGKDEYGMKCEARFVFACNDMPKFGDATTGMWEKLYMIPFNRYIKAEERDPGIFKRLETELPGVMNFALDGLSVLMERKKLTQPKAVTGLLKDYREESDSVYDFFSQRLVIEEESKFDRILLKEVFIKYRAFCGDLGIKYPVELKQFSKRMQRIIKESDFPDSMTVNFKKGQYGRYFTGLRYRKINNLQILI